MPLSINERYKENGLTIIPAEPHADDYVKVIYDGLLVKCGAASVFAHVGFGDMWDKIHDYEMEKTANGFEVNVLVQPADSLNIVFKDCASNWDNNSGKNYNFDIVLTNPVRDSLN